MFFIPDVFNLLILTFLIFLTFILVSNIQFKYNQFIYLLLVFLVYLMYANYALYLTYYENLSNLQLISKIPPLFLLNFSVLIFPYMYVFILITLTSLLYCFAYNYSEIFNFTVYVIFIFIGGLVFFLSNSLFFFFLGYESLLLPSFLILYNFAKTRKSVEAAYLMFFWTQFGALFLVFSFQYIFFINNSSFIVSPSTLTLSYQELVFINLMLIIGFGVKFPIWPFYEWLPKAHVEASTNFSVFLSGVLVKFAFFGYLKLLFFLNNEHSMVYLVPYLIIGIVDSSLKIYYQLDVKKLVAYSTVLEMHWLLIAILSGQSFITISVFLMLISHAVVSTNFFFIVDMIARRLKTRLVSEISGLYYLIPNLYTFGLLWIVIFLGFPGTILFLSEFVFFSYLLDLDFLTFLFIFFFTYLIAASFFFKNWFNMLFGNFYTHSHLGFFNPLDVDLRESLILTFYVTFMFIFSLSFQFFTF